VANAARSVMLKEGDRYDMNFLTVTMRKLTPLDERLIKRYLNDERVDSTVNGGGEYLKQTIVVL